jgi:ubiquitin-like protein 5
MIGSHNLGLSYGFVTYFLHDLHSFIRDVREAPKGFENRHNQKSPWICFLFACCLLPIPAIEDTGSIVVVVTTGNIMIEVILDDRLGKKVRVKCNEDDTIGDLKKLAAAQLGTRPEKLKIQKWYTVYKVRLFVVVVVVRKMNASSNQEGESRESSSSSCSNASANENYPCCSKQCSHSPPHAHIHQDHITLEDYEVHDGMSLELYYQ